MRSSCMLGAAAAVKAAGEGGGLTSPWSSNQVGGVGSSGAGGAAADAEGTTARRSRFTRGLSSVSVGGAGSSSSCAAGAAASPWVNSESVGMDGGGFFSGDRLRAAGRLAPRLAAGAAAAVAGAAANHLLTTGGTGGAAATALLLAMPSARRTSTLDLARPRHSASHPLPFIAADSPNPHLEKPYVS